MIFDKIKPYTNVIWDWNGTLLNDVQINHEALVQQLTNDGFDPPTLEEYREKFGFPVKKYYSNLGYKNIDVKYNEIAENFMRFYHSNYKRSRLHDGVVELLERVALADKQQHILSAAEQTHLDEAVDHFQIKKYFSGIFGIRDEHGRGKINRGHEMMRITEIDPKETILIGDTDHDYEVAQSLGVDVLLIADGHQSYERIKDLHHMVMETRHANTKKIFPK